MNAHDIREAYRNGNSNWEILHMVVSSGVEFPDAVFRVSQALRLDHEAVAEMESNYDEVA